MGVESRCGPRVDQRNLRWTSFRNIFLIFPQEVLLFTLPNFFSHLHQNVTNVHFYPSRGATEPLPQHNLFYIVNLNYIYLFIFSPCPGSYHNPGPRANIPPNPLSSALIIRTVWRTGDQKLRGPASPLLEPLQYIYTVYTVHMALHIHTCMDHTRYSSSFIFCQNNLR